MMAKIRSGQGFAGLVDYANDIKNKETNIIASDGVDLTSNKSIVASFNLQAKSRPSLKNFVGHVSLSFAPDDTPKLTDRLMTDIAKEYMQRMGIVNTQYAVFRHHDKPHAHVHIVYNRVNNNGNAITGDQAFRKSASVTQALTREYGLTFGKGKKKVNRNRLKGKEAIKYRIYDAVDEALKECRSLEALRAALSARGIGMDIVCNAEGKARGVVFTCDNLSFAGYRIDCSMTYAKLRQRMCADLSHNSTSVISAADNRTERRDFSFGRQRSDTTQEADNCRETATAESLNGTTGINAAGGNASAYGGIGEAMTELIMQPHVAQTGGGGGGGSDDRSWNDEDKEKKKNLYRRRR